MTSHSDGVATDTNRAVVAATVATVGGSVGNGAVVVVTVANATKIKNKIPRNARSQRKKN